MANNVVFNVSPYFNVDFFSQQLAESFRMKGYNTSVVKLGIVTQVSFEKGTGGINTVLGMGEGVKANITQNGNTVTISFVEEEWTSKIIACVIGWFLCWIPIVTGIIGVVNQLNLPKTIGSTAISIAASM